MVILPATEADLQAVIELVAQGRAALARQGVDQWQDGYPNGEVFLQDVEKIEAALDIAVITSRAEALCLSILESMIAGIPAVGTDSGGVAEVIRHGENGFLIPVGDSDALAERLDELLTDDAKRNAFGAQAKKDAEATFLAEQMTRKIEKLYLEAGK